MTGFKFVCVIRIKTSKNNDAVEHISLFSYYNLESKLRGLHLKRRIFDRLMKKHKFKIFSHN